MSKTKTPANTLVIMEKMSHAAGKGGNSIRIVSSVAAVVGPDNESNRTKANEVCTAYNKASDNAKQAYAVEELLTVTSVEQFNDTVAVAQREKHLEGTIGRIPPSLRATMAVNGQLNADEVAEYEAIQKAKADAKEAEKKAAEGDKEATKDKEAPEEATA